jgi:hypothetical protein
LGVEDLLEDEVAVTEESSRLEVCALDLIEGLEELRSMDEELDVEMSDCGAEDAVE